MAPYWLEEYLQLWLEESTPEELKGEGG